MLAHLLLHFLHFCLLVHDLPNCDLGAFNRDFECDPDQMLRSGCLLSAYRNNFHHDPQAKVQ